MWPNFYCVTYIFGVAIFFLQCHKPFTEKPSFWNVLHISKCDALFKIWPVFHSVTQFFPNVTHFLHCGTVSQMWTSFYSVTCFFKPTFQSATHFTQCNQFFIAWPIYLQSDPFFEIYSMFYNVMQFSKYHPFFTEWLIFPNFTNF